MLRIGYNLIISINISFQMSILGPLYINSSSGLPYKWICDDIIIIIYIYIFLQDVMRDRCLG